MATINLPDGASWDTDKHFEEQTYEARQYIFNCCDILTPVINSEEECNGSGVFRWTERQYEDTDNSITIIETREYLYAHNDPAAFAIKDHNVSIS